jgi:putative redox protein
MIRATNLRVPYQTEFSNGTHSATADVPLEKGGAGLGFGPHELLEAALATCLTMTVQMCASKHKIPLQHTQCEVRIDRSIPNTVTFYYTLNFEGMLTTEQTTQLRQAASQCPVARTLSGAIGLKETPATTVEESLT